MISQVSECKNRAKMFLTYQLLGYRTQKVYGPYASGVRLSVRPFVLAI